MGWIQDPYRSKIEKGNVISVQNIPDGTIVCNIERHFGDGGAIVKSAGTNATVFSHGDEGVTLKLPPHLYLTRNITVLIADAPNCYIIRKKILEFKARIF